MEGSTATETVVQVAAEMVAAATVAAALEAAVRVAAMASDGASEQHRDEKSTREIASRCAVSRTMGASRFSSLLSSHAQAHLHIFLPFLSMHHRYSSLALVLPQLSFVCVVFLFHAFVCTRDSPAAQKCHRHARDHRDRGVCAPQ